MQYPSIYSFHAIFFPFPLEIFPALCFSSIFVLPLSIPALPRAPPCPDAAPAGHRPPRVSGDRFLAPLSHLISLSPVHQPRMVGISKCLGYVRGPSTLHAESPLLADFTFQLFPSCPLAPATPSGPIIPLRLISCPPLALPVHHTPFRSTTRPSGPFPATEPAGNARDRFLDHRTGISYVLDSLTFFLQARSIILLELSILLC